MIERGQEVAENLSKTSPFLRQKRDQIERWWVPLRGVKLPSPWWHWVCLCSCLYRADKNYQYLSERQETEKAAEMQPGVVPAVAEWGKSASIWVGFQ